MNYFRCTVGGGKGNTVTVTCAEEFAGLTITLAKTGKTYTKTCPSTAPYVVTFNGVENGTYTVSCTVDGETYSETVIVQDISCVLNYGFTWRLWVDTASQLDSSDYDSLDEVLADEKALRELFLEHACVDYMASVAANNEDLETVINNDLCAKWINLSDYALDFLHANEIIADLMDEADKYFYGEWVITDSTTTPPTWGPKGNVPVMTSTTAPYGTVTGTNAYSSTYPLNYAFEHGNMSTSYLSVMNTDSIYVQYQFINPVIINHFVLKFAGYDGSVTITHNCLLQASNDGTNWDTLGTYNGVQTTDNWYTFDEDLANTTPYLYVRFTRASSNASTNTRKAIYINGFQVFGRELKVSVPTMTSNTAPFGEAFASSVYGSNNPAWKAFDNSTSTNWASIAKSNPVDLIGEYLGYDFKNSVVVKAVKIVNYNDAGVGQIGNYKLQGSNDNSTWEDIETVAHATTANLTTVDGIENDNAYSAYRIVVITTNANANANINAVEANFYGLDYSEKEFEAGTTKKWLYDHGVELVELDKLVGSNGGTIADNGHEFVTSDGTTDGFNNFGQVCTKNKIDITNYSWLFAKYGDEILGTTTSGYVGEHGGIIVDTVKPNGTYANETAVAVFSKNTPLTGLQIGGSVSAINSEYYIRFGTGYWKNIKSSYTEAWLE